MNTQKKTPDAKKCPKRAKSSISLDQELLDELQLLIKALTDKLDQPGEKSALHPADAAVATITDTAAGAKSGSPPNTAANAAPDESADASLGAAADKKTAKKANKSILLARMVDNLSDEDWLALSQQYDLRSWLALPLDSSAAKAIETLQETLDKLVFQRDHDPLTGLANRRYMERFLKTELERAARTNTALSLIMIDLDHFKQVNDRYGHLCGDQVLQKLGSFLLHSRRSYDLAARYGGEEFIIILPGISFLKATSIAQRLLEQFSALEFKCNGHEAFHMTFSAGVAGVSPKTGYKTSMEELIKLADEAMYAAKNAGRARVELSQKAVEKVTDSMVMAEEKNFLFNNLE